MIALPGCNGESPAQGEIDLEEAKIQVIVGIIMDFLTSMLRPEVYPKPTTRVEFLQTYISYIFLTDQHVYKVKKPVNFGYLDFSTLRKRHYYLQQELVLNRRLAPEMYLAVLPIAKRHGSLKVGGAGQIVEYALQMLRLPQHLMMDEIADRQELTPAMLARIVGRLVPFYQEAATGGRINKFGHISVIRFNHEENFKQIEPFVGSLLSSQVFRDMVWYAETFLREQSDLFAERLKSGKIRDCHGDLHMKNICLADGVYIFDCIEFNPRFRYSDVAADIAFLAMDLDFHGYADLSRFFCQSFADQAADSDLLHLLPFYKSYRAVVRGKINALASQAVDLTQGERHQAAALARRYFELAWQYSQEGR